MKKSYKIGIAITSIFLITIVFVTIIVAVVFSHVVPQKFSFVFTKNITSKLIDTGKEKILTIAAETSESCDEPLIQTSEEESLLTITQAAAGCQMEAYIYVDMDHDGSKELIGVCRDDTDSYQTWYCSSDGTICLPVHQNIDWMDACAIVLLEYEQETHVVINAYRLLGTVKNYAIIALRDDSASCLLSDKYGYVYMGENGDIILDVEAYDAMYDAELGYTIGHTWNDTYLYFDGETYREYGAVQITEAEYLKFENAQNLKDRIVEELTESDTSKLEFSYFLRKNNLLHIQCDVYNNYGTIQYGYYTVRFSDSILDDQLGEYTAGQMAPYFSDLEVTY